MRVSVGRLALGSTFALMAGAALLWPRAPEHGATPSQGADVLNWQGILANAPEEGFDRAPGKWRLGLPGDHGAHAGARTETWSIAAQLSGEGGEPIGLQFSLSRAALALPGGAEDGSPWGMQEAYRGHVALASGQLGSAVGEERFHRGMPGVAGHDARIGDVRLDHWSLRYGEGAGGDRLRLDAAAGEGEVEIVLSPAKPALALNESGADAPFQGYAITRMDAEGFVEIGGVRTAVTGLAWLDHIWGEVPLPVGPVVWDRLQLQLDDGTDLSVTRTRRRDGGGTSTVSGFAVGPDGRATELAGLEMEASREWRRDAAAAPYRLDWMLRAGDTVLGVTPLVDDQAHGFAAPLWSGAVTAQGRLDGEPVSGRGAMTLTGTEGQ